jgi:hypothetical protein
MLERRRCTLRICPTRRCSPAYAAWSDRDGRSSRSDLEFPTFEEAEAWYDSPAYRVAVVRRFRGARFRTFILQGVD